MTTARSTSSPPARFCITAIASSPTLIYGYTVEDVSRSGNTVYQLLVPAQEQSEGISIANVRLVYGGIDRVIHLPSACIAAKLGTKSVYGFSQNAVYACSFGDTTFRTYALPIRIGSGCWLGGGAIVLPGVAIGEGCVIGAGSVVTRDIPPKMVAAGNPCRVLRPIGQRDREYYFRDRKVDVEIPTYTLDNTVMGNLTLGTYTVKGLTYDEEKGGFYRDYKDDGLTFHFSAETGGKKTMDGNYSFNPEKDNNILVKYNGNKVEDIVNTFQMGSMPFAIVSKFTSAPTAITSVKSNGMGDGKIYNLNGQMVDKYYKGVVIVNGKKYLKK